MSLWRTLVAAYCLLGVGPAGPVLAQTLDEAQIKAAFIFNFIQFTTWPPGTLTENAPVPVCVRPDGDIGRELSAIAGRKVPGRSISLRALPRDGTGGCAVIVVDRADATWLAGAGDALSRAMALVVADDNGGEIRGATITLALSGRKVVFDVDAGRAKSVGLTISSRVMQLARAVK